MIKNFIIGILVAIILWLLYLRLADSGALVAQPAPAATRTPAPTSAPTGSDQVLRSLPYAPIDWIIIRGQVELVNPGGVLIRIDPGIKLPDGATSVIVESRPWVFAAARDFHLSPGDRVEMTIFHDGQAYETGRLTNLTSGESIDLRDEHGIPQWAGFSNP